MFSLILFIIMKIFCQDWNRIETNHFDVYIEGKWVIPALTMELEKIYSLMKMNLSPFSPWMLKEKTKIYIYKNHQSYVSSEFSPPKWSKGICIHNKRTVVVYYKDSVEDLLATVVHELTHLYYEDFFLQKLKSPPIWLNEGLAVYMEYVFRQERSPWYQSLIHSPKSVFMGFEIFFKSNPNNLSSDEEIAYWYLQSFAIIKYLLGFFGKSSFYRFSLELSNTSDLNKSLWKVYRFSDLKMFEKKWFEWLNQEKAQKNFEFKPFKTLEFNRFN